MNADRPRNGAAAPWCPRSEHFRKPNRGLTLLRTGALVLGAALMAMGTAQAGPGGNPGGGPSKPFEISKAQYKDAKGNKPTELKVEGSGTRQLSVDIANAGAPGTVLWSVTVENNGRWSFDTTGLAPQNVPCRVRAVQSDGASDEMDVQNAPPNCDPGAPVNTPPVANDDSLTTAEDTSGTVDVLANDSDADGDTLTVSSVGTPGNGSAVDNGDGTVTYTPDADFNGSDSFGYSISDGNGGTASATVNVTVTPVNDAPVAADDSYTASAGQTLSVAAPGVLGNDSDVDGDTLSAVLVSGASGGSLSLSGDGSFTYTPAAGTTSDSFTYQASDGTASSNTATVSITVEAAPNTPPVANDDSLTTDEDTSGTVDVLANDSDADGDTLTVSSVGTPANGSAVNNGDGTVTYTPNLNFNGSDSFGYSISDGNGGTANATVNVTVTPVNDAPVAADDSYTASAGQTLSVAAPGVLGNDSDVDGDTLSAVLVSGTSGGSLSLNGDGSFTYTPAAGTTSDSFTYQASDGTASSNTATVSITVQPAGNTAPVASDDTFVIDRSVVARNGNALVPAPGVLINDADAEGDPLSAVLVSGPTGGAVSLNADGSFSYVPDAGTTSDSFTYQASDATDSSATATVSLDVRDGLPVVAGQNQFNIMMNYELGMHCTGFEFAYCCVLPAYNSILAQVVKTDKGNNPDDFPMLLEGDPNQGTDALHRQTVLRDKSLDGSGNFNKYVLRYWHDAQPRNDGRGKPQSSTLISAVEGNSFFAWNTVFDAATTDADGTLSTGPYNGADGVLQGDGSTAGANDNYQNAVWNHLYIYADPATGTPNLEGHGASGVDLDKIRLGIDVVYPDDCGPALHPMGPVTQSGDPGNPTVANDCAGFSRGNVLTFSEDTGTIVYTKMKVLDDLPVTLTSPRIWEALGLPLTPFEDSIDFFGDPGLVDEDSIRPYVQMKAQMHHYDPNAPGGIGAAVMDAGEPVIGFGTAPIDIPNCERCHSNAPGTANSPNADATQWGLVQQEYNFWNAYYGIDPAMGDSDWYSRLKSAAISMLYAHDVEHGTSFAASYPGTDVAGVPPQNTRLGHESVICQRCHADNVIAAVQSATGPGGAVIKPVTEAIHYNHREVSEGGPIEFGDVLGRSGACQGCHPAHRSDGDMSGYPITLGGENFYAGSDNRLANGGCFVGRDVHSNPMKDVDGAETPEHLNAVGQWLSTNVFRNQAGLAGSQQDVRGIWCTNCHNQFGQEMWKAEDAPSLVHAQPGDAGNVREPVANASLQDVVTAVNASLGTAYSLAQVESWLDPRDPAVSSTTPSGGTRTADETHAVWEPNPGLCDYVDSYLAPGTYGPVKAAHDANVATVEVNTGSPGACTTGTALDANGDGNVDASDAIACNAASFYLCGSYDGENDFNVSLAAAAAGLAGVSPFCTTADCVSQINGSGNLGTSLAVPVPFSAATDGRDHWLAGGEPHCADCHAAPYVEQSGNVNAFAPFNYPFKASLMRYSRGHQDITCQGCHESIHGLYPVTPTIDTTSYAQAEHLNHDSSHGPLKCGSCHAVDNSGIPTWVRNNGIAYNGASIEGDFDAAVSWAHTFTDEDSVLGAGDVCQNCHGEQGTNWADVTNNPSGTYLSHAEDGRASRLMMTKAETELMGAPHGTTDGSDGVCQGCHGDESGNVSCSNTWKEHLTLGRVDDSVWVQVSTDLLNDTCGW